MSTGFIWAYNVDGSAPLLQTFVVKNTVVFSEFEMANFDTGEADAAVTADTSLMGSTVEAVDNTSDGESVKILISPHAVYQVDDANARTVGDLLDIAGGGLGVTSPSNNDLVVVETSTASEETLVMFNDNYFRKV
jgi:hypothetical protein